MRILLVAPKDTGLPELDIDSEMNAINARHEVRTLTGKNITIAYLYEAVGNWRGDVVHYISHMGPDGIAMAGGEVMDRDNLSSISRVTRAPILFLNGCNANELASFSVRHGVKFALYGNAKVSDLEALRFAIRFYSAMGSSITPVSVAQALAVADNSDGKFGWTVALDVMSATDIDVVNPLNWRNWHARDWRTWLMLLMATIVAFLVIQVFMQ